MERKERIMWVMKKLALLGLVLQLTGCAVLGPKDESAAFLKPYQYDSSKSYALNVMNAARLDDGLYDMRRPKDFGSVGPNSGVAGEVVEGALTAAAWSGLTAVGKGVFLGSSGKARKVSDFPHIFAWVPKSTAEMNSVAELLFHKKIMGAVKDFYVEQGLREVIYPNGPMKNAFVFEGKGCSKTTDSNQENQCNVTFWGYMKVGSNKREEAKKLVAVISPLFIQNGESYFTYVFEGYSLHSYMNLSETPAIVEGRGSRLERYLEYSKSLPKWVFLYLPQRWNRKNIEDYPNLPVLINQGKIHYFFTPEKG